MDSGRKAQFERRAVIGLLVVLAFLLQNSLRKVGVFGSRVASQPLEATVQPVLPQVAPQAPEPIEVTAQERGPSEKPIQYTAEVLRDPLSSLLPEAEVAREPATPALTELRPSVTPPQPPPVTIQGMIWGGPRPQVLIEGRLYGIGDIIQGARIIGIEREGATVEIRGSAFVLPPQSSSGTSQTGPMAPHTRKSGIGAIQSSTSSLFVNRGGAP